MKKILRTHDELYLREDRYEAVKESFKFEGNLIADKRKVILEQRVEAVESEDINESTFLIGVVRPNLFII